MTTKYQVIDDDDIRTFDSAENLIEYCFKRGLWSDSDVVGYMLNNEYVKSILVDLGWVDTMSIKNQKEKIKNDPTFYVISQDNKIICTSNDLTMIRQYYGRYLVTGSLTQKVKTSSLKEINPSLYNEYLKQKRQYTKEQNKIKILKDKRNAKQKARRIARARQLLKESGEL